MGVRQVYLFGSAAKGGLSIICSTAENWFVSSDLAKKLRLGLEGLATIREQLIFAPFDDCRMRSTTTRPSLRFRSLAMPWRLAARLRERDVQLIRACEIANQDLDGAEIEKEFDGIGDEMAEPWE